MATETVEVKFTGNSASLQQALNGAAGALQKTATKSTKLNTRSKRLNQTLRAAATSMKRLGGNVDAVIGRYASLYALTQTGINLFKRGFFAIESFNTQVIQTGALWTSFSSDLGTLPVAEVFEKALASSEKLHQRFIDVNDQTLATVEQMGIVNRELAKQGIQLNSENESQMKSFINVTNTIAILTTGMANRNLQFGQEIRAVLEGLAKQGTTLSLILKAKLGPAWRATVGKWKDQGAEVFLRKLAEQFKGIDAAAIKLKGTWALVGTSFSSLFDTILRLGMEDVFKDIINAVAELNGYLKENREELGRTAREGFNKIADSIKRLLGVNGLKTLEENVKSLTTRFKILFTFLTSVAVLSGIGNLTLAILNLQRAIGLLVADASFATVIGLLSNPVALGGVVAVLGAAAAWKTLGTSLDHFTPSAETAELAAANLNKQIAGMDLVKLNQTAAALKNFTPYNVGAPNVPGANITIDDSPLPILDPPTLAGTGNESPEPPKTSDKDIEATLKNLDEIKKLTEALQKPIESLQKSWTKAFMLMADSAKSFGEKLEDVWIAMRDAVTEMATQMIAKLLATLALQALLSIVSGGLSALKFANAAAAVKGVSQSLNNFDSGTMNVDRDQVANIHQGEIIIPKTFSDDIRAGKSSLGQSSETNSLLGAMLGKMDALINETAGSRNLNLGDSGMVELTKSVNNTNFRLGYMGV